MCDVCLLLDSDLRIIDGEDRLRSLLLRAPRLNSDASNFLQYLCSEDAHRFKDHTKKITVQQSERMPPRPAVPLNASMMDSSGTAVSCHFFCAALPNRSGSMMFMLGVNESEERVNPREPLNLS